jgi:4-carboxymuconolactone decarboxylase
VRLPLLCPEDLPDKQRPVYESFEKATQAEEYQGFEVRNADGAFVGPWGVMLHFAELATPLGRFIDLVQNLDGVSERARQVVILTIGGRLNLVAADVAAALTRGGPGPGPLYDVPAGGGNF